MPQAVSGGHACCHITKAISAERPCTCESVTVGLHVLQAKQTHGHASPQAVPLCCCDVLGDEALGGQVQVHVGRNLLEALLDDVVLATGMQFLLSDVKEVLDEATAGVVHCVREDEVMAVYISVEPI